MSTMLKSAAMTLLSKTLQTFLYKYLLDVDVEGVNMPSILSSDVDGGGWGVRLCNVRLREGVELMALPGKRKDAEDRSAKKNTSRKKPKKRDESTNGVEKGSAASQKGVLPTGSSEDSEELGTGGNHVDIHSSSVQKVPGHTVPPIEREMLPTPRASWDLDDTSLCAADASSRPPTPDMQSARNRMFGCFVRESDPPSNGEVTNLVETPSVPGSRSRSPGLQEPEGLRGKNKSTFQTAALSAALEEVVLDSKKKAHLEGSAEVDDGNDGSDEEIGSDDDVDDADAGLDMTLRLGNGGRIGTLDVRLVGKELHVSIEDAFLVVEACPKPVVAGGANDTDSLKSDGSGKQESAKSPERPKPTGKKSEGKTVGDRVLENSTIARLLSTIPHLFLRDCRVQIIHREKAPPSEGVAESEISTGDGIIEIGVELLSVATGEDILAHVRLDEEMRSDHDAQEIALDFNRMNRMDGTSDDNEYLIKRVRTGRGPEGGIWMKVFPPGKSHFMASPSPVASESKSARQWANELWSSTVDFCFFRCSGLDVRARIFLGKHEEVSEEEWHLYDEFSIDTMLYTVDYVAPGPAPALPPLERGISQMSEGHNMQNPATSYQTDHNGIQSSRVPSNFHRVACGLVPSVCSGDHLPGETCSQCWDSDSTASQDRTKDTLDSSMPLPGLVFSLSLKDPLEVNVDRSALEELGKIIRLFSSDTKHTSYSQKDKQVESEHEAIGSRRRASRALASIRDRWAKKEEEGLIGAFPSYMQPECIEVLGVHLSKLVARIHVMRADGSFDSGRSFCYWDTVTNCITIDSQNLSSDQKKFQDVRFEVGKLTMTEHRGAEFNHLLSMGLSYPDVDDSDLVSRSSNPILTKHSSKPAWPNVASTLLNIQPPHETTHYKSRERHGLQVRYMSLDPPTGRPGTESRSYLNIRVGTLSIDMPYQVKSDVSGILSESTALLFGRPDDASMHDGATSEDTNLNTPSSLMKYKFQVDGGKINLPPVVNMRLPLTKFSGGRSSESGMFLETIFNKMVVEYGARPQPVFTSPQQLSLAQMASLPETIRMRIVLFLKDLGPLEQALGIKRESNTFLRCRSVNKGFAKLAKRTARAFHKHRDKVPISPMDSAASRRQQLLGEFMKLDDSALEDLWHSHQKSQKRHRKSRSTGQGS